MHACKSAFLGCSFRTFGVQILPGTPCKSCRPGVQILRTYKS
jgi:hypothetical protein